MCEWICLQGPGFKLTSRPHLFPDGFLRDIMAWENKHRNERHRNLALWDGLASETNPPQLHYKYVACDASRYEMMTYCPIFLGKKNHTYCKSKEIPGFSPGCNQWYAGISLWCKQILTKYHAPAAVNSHCTSI